MRIPKIIVPLALAVLLAACSETKYVADGDYLLDKVNVVTDEKHGDINTTQMKSYVRQQGNSRWFSSVKIPLATYSLSGRDSTKWINKTLRKMGEEPMLYDTTKTRQSTRDLRNQLQNLGYLNATASADTTIHGKKIDVTYTLMPGSPYYIGRVNYDVKDTAIAALLSIGDTASWGLRHGMRFNIERLDGERKRITNKLVNSGYYKFHKDYISFKADSTRGSREINLTLVLHQFRDAGKNAVDHPRYSIGDVTFGNTDNRETGINLRKSVLDVNTFITPGSYYAADKLQRTYNRLGRLQAVRFTNITFRERPDTTLLDCDIMLGLNKPHSISFQPEGTNTAGDLGAAASLTYQNNNIFRGSEVFSVELRSAFEAISGLEGYDNDNFEEYSVEAKLQFPRFIVPFISSSFRRRTNATSELSVMYDLQNRPEYHRRVFSVAWRYKWANTFHNDRYQIDLLDLSYVYMPWISDKFRQDYLENATSSNAILRYNYEDLLITKFGLGYSYNNGTYAIRANVETSGNVLGLTSKVFNYKKNSLGQNIISKIAYAQYAKADFEYTLNMKFDYNNTLVLHAGFGIAYPYGNSTILPFEKRYFSGGANSVRGWSVRGLGPGKFVGKDGNIDFINQTGDMKLDVNLEYRAHLFWKFNGALFIDAGNVWTLRNYDDQLGGQFKLDTFIEQIAVSYGLGIRLNFDYFILRFDFGMKAVNPAYSDNRKHYPLIHPRLSRDLTFHFAVGLPF